MPRQGPNGLRRALERVDELRKQLRAERTTIARTGRLLAKAQKTIDARPEQHRQQTR